MENLKKLRLSKNLNQAQLAEIVGVQRNTISRYEKGDRQPDYATLSKLADFFSVSTDYLLGLTDKQTTPDTKKEAPAISQAEALRIYAEGKKGMPLTQEELNRLDEVIDVIIKGIGN